MIIGQEQDGRGSGFSAPESFAGRIALLHIWSRVLDDDEIAGLRMRCDTYRGDVRAWPDFMAGLRGRVYREESHFCTGCAIPDPPPNGELTLRGMRTEARLLASCAAGHEAVGATGAEERLCLASGDWSGEPAQCARISCGHPGHLANGYINGRQYRFQDIVQYVCNPGHRLVGESTRTCRVDGKWSGNPPRCEEILCEAPARLENGFLSGGGKYRLGHRIQATCEDGYRLDGAATLTCSGRGEWGAPLPLCQPRNCESPPRAPHAKPLNGSFHAASGGVAVGAPVRYECDRGFEMKAGGEVVCAPGDRWEGELPRCERVVCPIPVAPLHGHVEGKEHRYGDQIEFRCEQGYEIVGDERSVCRDDGTWSTAPPECTPVRCGKLAVPERGAVDAGEGVFGSVAKYVCMPGYELQGVRSRKCRSNGEWSGEEPVCVPVSCSQPESISNGRYSGGDWTVGNTVTYSCNPGFLLLGESERVCLETGVWLHPAPACEPLECPEPDPIDNGSWKTQDLRRGFAFGARVAYACDAGHRPAAGAAVRVCTEEQRWEPAPPECRPVSCGQPPAQSENLVVQTTSTILGGIARYSCAEGFRLEGPAERECSADGKWSGNDPSCEVITCPDPLPVEHAYLIYADNRYGSGVEYYCDEGFKLTGPVQRLCSGDGRWTGAEPRCSPIRCAAPRPPQDGEVEVRDTRYRSAARYLCRPGFELLGPVERACLSDETWSGAEPECRAVRCPLEEGIENGRVLGDSDLVGSTVQFECDVGFYLIGPSARTCLENKSWTEEAPRCERVTCPVPIVPEHGEVAWKGRYFGDTVSVTCAPGHVLSGGDATRPCLPDGSWGGSPPACDPVQCPAPVSVPAHGRVSAPAGRAFGSGRLEYGCEPGFRLKGPRRRTCRVDGSWSDRQPECARIFCPDPPLLPHGRSVTPRENLTVGVEVEYSCNKGFILEYQSPRTRCGPQGKWTGLPPTCRAVQCPTVPALAFGFVDGKNFSYGSAVHVSCEPGWKLVGETTIKCEHRGDWSAPFPRCEGISCPEPDRIENGFLVPGSDDFRNGATVRYECAEGHRRVGGAAELVCRGDNRWSGKPPSCVPVKCPEPRAVPNAEHVTEGLEYSKVVRYVCEEGYVLHGETELRCEADGKWSSDAPVCERVSCPLPDPLPRGEVLVPGSLSRGSSGRDIRPSPNERGDIAIDKKDMLAAARTDVFRLGDKITHRCSKGHRLKGPLWRECLPNGTWSGDRPKCDPVKCNAPENLAMGEMAAPSRTYDAEVRYKCEPGYELRGPSVKKCGQDATWSPAGAPSCVPISCPLPQDVPHGKALWNSSRYGAALAYECHPGYKMIGDGIRLCGLSGSWSGEEPHCVTLECPAPQGPVRGWVETEGLVVGSAATYRCEEGFELEGPPTRSCLANETWSHEPPVCRPVSCSPPLSPDHGRVVGGNHTFGAQVNFECDEGYELEGSPIATCLADRSWSEGQPLCAPLPCPRPVPPAHGTVLYRQLVVGSSVLFSCVDGHRMSGRPDSTCRPDQTWDADPPDCDPVICTTLKPPRYGHLLYPDGNLTVTTFGTRVRFECESGYRMEGPESVECTVSGNWSEPAPLCIRHLCDVPETVPHARATVGPFVVGHEVEYTCDPGYFMKSKISFMQCKADGRWEGKRPRCAPVDCGEPPHVPNSEQMAKGGRTLGGTVAYVCEEGYRLEGSAKIACKEDGLWSSAPTCEEIRCDSPPPLEHANETVHHKPGLSEVTYACVQGYRLVGPARYLCKGGGDGWNVTSYCQRVVCGEPPSIPYGKILATAPAYAGDRGIYKCFPGYRAVGSTAVECSWRGSWEGRPPHCVPVSCPAPAPPEDGSVSGEDFSFQAAVRYSCRKGFRLHGRDERFCLEDGSWSGEEPECRRVSCGPYAAPENLLVRAEGSNEFGDRVLFSCREGYRIGGGVDVARCLDNGEWDRPPPACTGVTCDPPDNLPSHLMLLPEGRRRVAIGEHLRLYCSPGFRPFGELVMRCHGNGTWSAPAGTCKKVECGRPRSGSLLPGGALLCPPGSRLKGPPRCTEDGRWSRECECARPCRNGGRCLKGACVCPSGFVGDICQHAVCILPCLHGGTCVGPYTCQCTDGFTGSRCQIPIGFAKQMLF